ncbi:biliverdin-producing heme oxygenase [Acinetobacter sp. WZC-1]|uniref:biliverdin-producing heme oxygenase n=1 Tax=Acinetobacter sp. WZC-1 TaxID=3459034 RepID=UPI00403E0B25
MNTGTHLNTAPGLSQRLKTETVHEHDRMEQLMDQAHVFDSKASYAQFTLSQYYFQRDVEHLYQYPEIASIIPDVDMRGRSQLALQDLADLGVAPRNTEIATEQVDCLQALGWIYVSEGSTLGAAFLFKEAQSRLGLSAESGARNLAAYPEGRMRVWKRFKQALDDAGFNQQQQDQVLEGAMQGFARFGQLLENLEQLQ